MGSLASRQLRSAPETSPAVGQDAAAVMASQVPETDPVLTSIANWLHARHRQKPSSPRTFVEDLRHPLDVARVGYRVPCTAADPLVECQ